MAHNGDGRWKCLYEPSEQLTNVLLRRRRLRVVVVADADVERRVRTREDPSVAGANRSVIGNTQMGKPPCERFVRAHVDSSRGRTWRDAMTNAELLQRFG